ncbi:hypothetical protein ACTWP4_18185 [Gracilibacillus sp. D59]|uniref:hypothetical protein n=1 Tax=Gracilibacillus sp. D59 TaxID=3457434 RepID=UPI003FCCA7EB
MTQRIIEFKSNLARSKELNPGNSNILYQEITPLRDILSRKKSPITQIAKTSKTRYTKDLERLRQKALDML